MPNQQSSIKKLLLNWRNWLALLGFGVIVIALLGDVLLSGAELGIGPLQIAVALVGLGIIVLSRLRGSVLGRMGIVGFSVLIMIVLFELVLGALGYKTEYSAPPTDMDAIDTIEPGSYRICDELIGCHYHQEIALAGCDDNSTAIRCFINREGFNNPEDFTVENLQDGSYRILVLGDSFTFGPSAPYGFGWVDVLRDELQAEFETVEVWNASFPGTGTHQAIITARYLMPIMQPDLVILGFHTGNDLADNLYPYDRFIEITTEDGRRLATQQYTLTTSGVIRETPQIIYYRALGYRVSSVSQSPTDQVTSLLTRTRLGTLLVGIVRIMTEDDRKQDATVEALTELESVVESNNSRLMIMIAPEQADTINRTRNSLTAIRAFEQVGIPYVDPTELLTPDDFENSDPTDKHWNQNGQAIAGNLMVACVSYIIENDGTMCPGAVTPEN